MQFKLIIYYLTIFTAVDCEWDVWNMGECDKSCGGGFRTNTRVPKVDEQHGGEKCTGASNVTESCNIQECPGKFYYGIIMQNEIKIKIPSPV